EILDWYHLVENLHKVGGSIKRLHQAESLLWHDHVEAAIALFSACHRKQAKNFCEYLRKHQHRIVNYAYFQAEGLYSIGSGAVESAIKQIGRRVKLSGAQWNRENVPQVLAHRCAYLNGLIGSPPPTN
ncbi:MAG TPA: ISKra4 family transposase, partial [Candidatus Obscuribacterales bacterium]